jgi:hypothetical protein
VSAGAWLSTSELATALSLSDRAIRLRLGRGVYSKTRQRGGGRQIALECLPEPELQAVARMRPELAPVKLGLAPPLERRAISWSEASDSNRLRATRRRSAVVAYLVWLNARGTGRGLTAAKEEWVRRYLAETPEIGSLSVVSLERWCAAYFDGGCREEALLDRNDGSAKRGKSSLPREVRAFFRAALKSGDSQSVANAIRDTRYWAVDAGIELDAADDAFYRFAATLTKIELRATNADQDRTSSWLPSVRRDYTKLRAMKVVQADHHISDVFVRCDDPECGRGHRVWLTVFMDVRSRMVLSWVASFDYPNSDRILKAFRHLIAQHGLPDAVYIDNGKDFKKAFGKAIRTWGADAIDEAFFGNLLAALAIRPIFATPYRAQAKAIERLFGTFVRRIWGASSAYVGRLGKRTERVQRLFENPAELPTVTEFCDLLSSEIALYDTSTEHRGHGMDGRSPMQVFADTRIPRRDPDPAALAQVFWHYYVRMVRGAAVSIGSDRYRLADERVAVDYDGRYVQVLVDPDDIRSATIISGCAHCRPEVRRQKTIACGCANKGVYLCDAALWDRSTYSFDDPITVENKRTVKRLERAFRERVHDGDPRAVEQYADFRRRRPEILRRIAQRQLEEQQPLVALSNEASSTHLIPAHSKLARDISQAREFLGNPLQLSVEERALADSIVLPSLGELGGVTDAEFSLHAVPPIDDEVTDELAVIELDRRAREREQAGYCSATLDCPNLGPICSVHQQTAGLSPADSKGENQ